MVYIYRTPQNAAGSAGTHTVMFAGMRHIRDEADAHRLAADIAKTHSVPILNLG